MRQTDNKITEAGAELHNHVMGWSGPSKPTGEYHYFHEGEALCRNCRISPKVGGVYPENEMYLMIDPNAHNCRVCMIILDRFERWKRMVTMIDEWGDSIEP